MMMTPRDPFTADKRNLGQNGASCMEEEEGSITMERNLCQWWKPCTKPAANFTRNSIATGRSFFLSLFSLKLTSRRLAAALCNHLTGGGQCSSGMGA